VAFKNGVKVGAELCHWGPSRQDRHDWKLGWLKRCDSWPEGLDADAKVLTQHGVQDRGGQCVWWVCMGVYRNDMVCTHSIILTCWGEAMTWRLLFSWLVLFLGQ